MSQRLRELRARVALVVLCAGFTGRIAAQERCVGPAPIQAGSEWESYLRVMQVLGATELQPWTLRGFSPAQWASVTPPDSASPWGSVPRGMRFVCRGGRAFTLWPARMQTVYNSAFPFGENDGAMWAGRGLTVAADAGVTARFGLVTVTLAPMAALAQNSPFTLEASGRGGANPFADWRNPFTIDLPQRFGDGVYPILDAGESEVRFDAARVAVGVTTAHQVWGPAFDHPVLLGTNAAGFPRAFVESARPLDVKWLGRLHARAFWGVLTGSPYLPMPADSATHLVSGLVAVFQPRALSGLEVGGGRFFHSSRRAGEFGLTELARPFGGLFLSEHQVTPVADNQLASIFFRLTLPADGAEVYGEYGREDRSANIRMLWLTPDFDAAYLLGFRKAWRGSGTVSSFRAEVLNSRVTHLALSRSQAPWYVHSHIRSGHTYLGQALGSAAAYGGGASTLSYDRYTHDGRLTVRWERFMLGEHMEDSSPLEYPPPPDPLAADVTHIWSLSSLRFGHRRDVELSLAFLQEFNRHFHDAASSVRVTASFVPVPSRKVP